MIIALVMAAGLVLQASAQSVSSPWGAVDQLRKQLFDVQKALLLDDQPAAQRTLEDGLIAFHATPAAEHIAANLPQAADALDAHFAQAEQAVAAGDQAAFALARGEVWSTLLYASYHITLDAVAAGDYATAADWLKVREYRPPTRFSRASADATLALHDAQAGRIDALTALAHVQADLLDTYQANASDALDDVRDGQAQGLPLKAAEAAGTLAGYWHILTPAYQEQFGTAAGEVVNGIVADLQAAALGADGAAVSSASQAFDGVLRSFRAAPLTEDEQARRAGQMLRFLSLVPIEYQRGVKNNAVFLDIEVQEAITFMAGAQAAFNDLRLLLDEIDPARTAALDAQLAALESLLDDAARGQQVVNPPVVTQATTAITDEIHALFPEHWLASNTASDLDVIATVLDQMENAVAQGQYDQAESARLEAYAIFDLGLEPRLLAFSPEMVARIDGLFWQGYEGQPGLAQAINTDVSVAEIREVRESIELSLVEAQRILGDGPTVPAVIIANAAVIVFREGLEAVVIIAALIAGMAGGYQRYRKPLVFGSVLALVATGVTGWLAARVLANFSAYGEKLEAVVSLIAIVVLLLITNWFFHKSYWTDWLASFHQLKYKLIQGETGQMLGLVALGFSSIYREGFETVLFLQALLLDAGAWIVLQGVALGLVGVLLVGVLIFRLQARLPYMKLFVITAMLIGGVLLILVGKTVHVFQAVAWLPITPIRGLEVPYWLGLWFGVYATWESLILQLVAAGFVVGSYFLAEYMRKRTRQQARAEADARRSSAAGASPSAPSSSGSAAK